MVAGALAAGVLTVGLLVLLVLFSLSEQAVKPSSAAASKRFAVVFMYVIDEFRCRLRHKAGCAWCSS